MPVILKLTEYEAGLVVDALATGRAALMKQWGSVFEQEVYDDGMFLLSKDSILENLDDNIAALGWVRKRLERAVIDTPPEGGKLDAVWHHKRGWIRPVDEIRTAAAIEARKRSQEFDLVELDAANSRDQDQMSPGTWTTIPEGFDVDAAPGYSFVGDIEEYAPDSNPFEITDADEPVTAGIDTQKASDGKVRIDIKIGGRTLTVDGSADLIKTLGDLNRRF